MKIDDKRRRRRAEHWMFRKWIRGNWMIRMWITSSTWPMGTAVLQFDEGFQVIIIVHPG